MDLPLAAGRKLNESVQSARQIVALSKGDAAAAAFLHQSTIPTSFLSSLGGTFSRQLYTGILSSPYAFGYACKGSDEQMLGFIACTEDTSKVYKSSLWRCGFWMAISLLPLLWRVSVIRRSWETLRYPSAVGDDLPPAEILCVAISQEAQGHGIGRELMQAALNGFRERGITRVKVAVGAGNATANHFYQRCSFTLAVTRLHHSRPMNIYTIQL